MTTQNTMTFAPTLADRFNEYDTSNPHVWELFKQFTRDAYKAGHGRFSAQAIIERIRWKTSVETRGGEFKINNDFASFYARKFHRENPHLDGFFRTRHSSADRFDTYPRSIACTAIVWLFAIGTIGIVGLLAVGA
jgi:hypothetical protein